MKFYDAIKYYYRIKGMVRYNTTPRLKDESVAEHSYFVALISLMLAERINDDIDIAKLLTMCIIHDLPEAKFSDIPYDSKIEIDLDLTDKEIDFFTKKKYKRLYEELIDRETLESKMVKFADLISVMVYSNQEIQLGNSNFAKIIEKVNILLDKFDYPEAFNNDIINESNHNYLL